MAFVKAMFENTVDLDEEDIYDEAVASWLGRTIHVDGKETTEILRVFSE